MKYVAAFFVGIAASFLGVYAYFAWSWRKVAKW